MNRSVLALATAAFMMGPGMAAAQTVIVPGEPVTIAPSGIIIPEDRVVIYRDQLIEAYPEPVFIEEDVEVGMVLPETIVVRPVPEAIIAEVPEAAAYEYVVAEDEVIFVEPGTNRVVAVVRQ